MEDRLFSIVSDGVSRFANNMIVSELMRHSVKYKVPFQIVIVTELIHHYESTVYGEKEELNWVTARTIFDTPRPHQMDALLEKLQPIRGVTMIYNDDPAIDCTNDYNNYFFRTKNYEKNLENFLEIRRQGDVLIDLMLETLHKNKYVQKLVDKGINYNIHKINNVNIPAKLSILPKQKKLYYSMIAQHLEENNYEGYIISEETKKTLIKNATLEALLDKTVQDESGEDLK